MLGGGHLVVLGGGGDAQLPELLVQVGHEGAHPVPDDAEVLVLQLLPLGGGGAEQGAAGVDQVPALQILLPVHQEILLLGTHRGEHLLGLSVAEQTQDAQTLGVDGLHGAQQRGLLVQGLPGVGDEDGGDAQDGTRGHLLYKGGRGHIPGGVAPGVVGGAQAAGGEGGGVGLAHDELLASELKDGLSVLRPGDKGVVLFGGDAGEGLEPVGVVGGPLLHRPVLHGVGHNVGGGHADVAPVLHHVHDLPEHPLGQALPHDGGAEDVGTEDLCHVHAHTFKPFPLPYRLPETKRGTSPPPPDTLVPSADRRALSAAVHWVHCIKNTVPAGILQVLKPTNFRNLREPDVEFSTKRGAAAQTSA